jgi:ATP-dependent DNA helicase PIF1
VLVIDEVSMLDAGLFDKLDYIARRVRGRDLPFGGIHLVIAGDFFQLPPVGLTGGAPSAAGEPPAPPIKFAFEATAWSRSIYAQLTLRRVFRQKDGGFVQMLNEFRVGVVTPAAERAVQTAGATVRAMEAARSQTKPTSIYALNKNVDEVNSRELALCVGTAVDYAAVDSGEEPFIGTLRSSCIAPTALSLKVGAQVMLIKNLDAEKGLVNGARGFVSRFVGGLPEVIFSVSAHAKSKKPAAGAAGAAAEPFNDDVSMILQPQEWTLELGSRVVATRQQIPLKLAYALSIHKSQGMTIDLLDVSMKGVFEYGQAYVALSRAVSLDRVRVSAFTAALVKAHPVVVAYYKWLEMPAPKAPFVPPPRPVEQSRAAGGAWGGNSGAGGAGNACYRCQKPGHFARDCPSVANT